MTNLIGLFDSIDCSKYQPEFPFHDLSGGNPYRPVYVGAGGDIVRFEGWAYVRVPMLLLHGDEVRELVEQLLLAAADEPNEKLRSPAEETVNALGVDLIVPRSSPCFVRPHDSHSYGLAVLDSRCVRRA